MAKKRGLNPKQRRFAEEYTVDFNATQAAKRAGYKSPASHGSDLLKNPDIQRHIRAFLDKQTERVELKKEDVLEELRRIGFSDLRKLAIWGGQTVLLRESEELDEDTARAVQEVQGNITVTTRVDENGDEVITRNVKVKAKLHPKLAALRALGEHFSIFSDDAADSRTPEEKAQEIKDAVDEMFGLTEGDK